MSLNLFEFVFILSFNLFWFSLNFPIVFFSFGRRHNPEPGQGVERGGRESPCLQLFIPSSHSRAHIAVWTRLLPEGAEKELEWDNLEEAGPGLVLRLLVCVPICPCSFLFLANRASLLLGSPCPSIPQRELSPSLTLADLLPSREVSCDHPTPLSVTGLARDMLPQCCQQEMRMNQLKGFWGRCFSLPRDAHRKRPPLSLGTLSCLVGCLKLQSFGDHGRHS